MAVVNLPLANQVTRQFADFPDVDMKFASKADFETAIANMARIPDGWLAYCIAEKDWFKADKDSGQAKSVGGVSTFAALQGNPADNVALSAVLAAKLAGVLSTDAEAQITATVPEDYKFVSRTKLFNWFSWIKTQAQFMTNTWSFTKGAFGTQTAGAAHGTFGAGTSSLAQILLNAGVPYTGSINGMLSYALSAGFHRLQLFKTGTGNVEILTSEDNPLYKGTTQQVLGTNTLGDVIQLGEAIEGITTDPDIIAALVAANYNPGKATITPANSKVFRVGQEYIDNANNFIYRAVADNIATIAPFGAGKILTYTASSLLPGDGIETENQVLTQYEVPHGLPYTPTTVIAFANSVDAMGPDIFGAAGGAFFGQSFRAFINGANIIIKYECHIEYMPQGENNMTWTILVK